MTGEQKRIPTTETTDFRPSQHIVPVFLHCPSVAAIVCILVQSIGLPLDPFLPTRTETDGPLEEIYYVSVPSFWVGGWRCVQKTPRCRRALRTVLGLRFRCPQRSGWEGVFAGRALLDGVGWT